jgi:RNA polymerase sigma factor (sigma-70 family)
MHPLCYADQMALLDNFVDLLREHKVEDESLLAATRTWVAEIPEELTFAAPIRRHIDELVQVVEERAREDAVDLARSALIYLTQTGDAERSEFNLQAHAFVISIFLHKVRRTLGETNLYVPAELEEDDRERAEDIFEKFLVAPMCSDALLIERSRSFCQDPGIPVDIDFVRRLLRNTEFLVSILEGESSGEDELKYARAALSYLVLEEDSIDDRLGLIGFIDDAHILDTAVSLIEPARQPWLQLLQATAWSGPILNQAKQHLESGENLSITQEALSQAALLSEPWALSGGPLNAALFTPAGGSAPIVLAFATLLHWLGEPSPTSASDGAAPGLEQVDTPKAALECAKEILQSDAARGAEQFVVVVAPHDRSRSLVGEITIAGTPLNRLVAVGYRNPEGDVTNWSPDFDDDVSPLLLFVPSLKQAGDVVKQCPGRVRLTLVDLELAVRGENEEAEELAEETIRAPASLRSTVDSKRGDVLEAYIGETTAIPRISVEEEHRLSLQMEAGRLQLARGVAILGCEVYDALELTAEQTRTVDTMRKLQVKIDQAREGQGADLEAILSQQTAHVQALGLDDQTFSSIVDMMKPYLSQGVDPGAVRRRWSTEPSELRAAYKELLTGRHKVDEAVVELTRGNLRLVLWMAKKYRNRTSSFLDMVQEGNVGLMRGARKFSHRKGARFGTYASWWVRQSIERYLAHHSRTIRIPVRALNTIKQVNRTAQELSARLGRIPTEVEIAERCDMSPDVVARAIKVAHELGSGCVTLDGGFDDDSDVSLRDVVADESTPAPFEQVSSRELADATHKLLETLKPMEAEVLRMRFGIGTGSRMTLEQIGQEVGLTRERIRQIELKALGKLRFRAKRMGVGP